MIPSDWRAQPDTAHFGPAAWQSSALALLTAIFVRPVLGALTLLRTAGTPVHLAHRLLPRLGAVTLGPNSHRRFVSKLSAATGAKVFNVGYRLAPQVLSLGFAPERIVLAGDSAGGLMAADVALAARDARLPVPAGQALMSPLT